MKEIIRIKEELEKSFFGGAWHGPSVLEALERITPEKALAKPLKNVHSIWEIVLHIEAWQNAVRRRLQGDPADLSNEEDWRTVKEKSNEAWSATLENLKKSLVKLIDSVSRFDETKLYELAAGQNYSNYFMLHGLAQHEAYHAGQIALLKKL